jgi:hypothetical protein
VRYTSFESGDANRPGQKTATSHDDREETLQGNFYRALIKLRFSRRDVDVLELVLGNILPVISLFFMTVGNLHKF